MTSRNNGRTTGEALRAARVKAKLSQDALANKLKLKSGRKGVIRWEQDKNLPDEPHQRHLIRLLRLPADFFERSRRAEARLSRRVAALEEAVGRIEHQLSDADAAQGP